MPQINKVFLCAISLLCILVFSACGNSGNNVTDPAPEATADAAKSEGIEARVAVETTVAENKPDRNAAVMDQPVNFSTPENVQESLQKIREQAGEEEVQNLQNAMNYMLFYDLSAGRDMNRLHKKLDGKTPNEIISSSAK